MEREILKDPNEFKTRITSTLKKLLGKEDDIYLGYLFGSFVKDIEFNDIDVGIVIRDKNAISNSTRFLMHLEHLFEKTLEYRWEFDVKILNFMPNYFQFSVIKEGQLFFNRDEKFRIFYETRVVQMYLDFQETLRWHSRQILERT
ncbi:MAG: nucleotidyltransferase domain-containing protein [Candidatus Helarchaeales archaeon]